MLRANGHIRGRLCRPVKTARTIVGGSHLGVESVIQRDPIFFIRFLSLSHPVSHDNDDSSLEMSSPSCLVHEAVSGEKIISVKQTTDKNIGVEAGATRICFKARNGAQHGHR